MNITGEMLIGATAVRGTDATLRAFDPARAPTSSRPSAAASRRSLAPARWRKRRSTPTATRRSKRRAQFLETIAERILGARRALIERAQAESGLPKARLEGERGRTVSQLRCSRARARRPLARRDARFGAARAHAAAAPRPAHAEDPGRPGRRVRRQQLPARVLGRGRRHGVGAGRRLPGRREGAPGASRARRNSSAARSSRRSRDMRPARRRVLAARSARATQSARRSSRIRRSRRSASPARARGGLALLDIAARAASRFPVYAEMSSINPLFAAAGRARAARGERSRPASSIR